MTPILLLAMWSAIGLFLAVRMSRPEEPGLAWAPVAVLLVPLWATVAIDRRMIADDERAHRLDRS